MSRVEGHDETGNGQKSLLKCTFPTKAYGSIVRNIELVSMVTPDVTVQYTLYFFICACVSFVNFCLHASCLCPAVYLYLSVYM